MSNGITENARTGNVLKKKIANWSGHATHSIRFQEESFVVVKKVIADCIMVTAS